MRLLIVDDSTIIRKALGKYLTNKGWEIVGEAGDGKTALEIFKATSPDLVTMDITMPEMDGLTCLDEIMKINNKAKVIVITALSDQATALQALKKGAKAFVGKPFSPEKLNDAISKVMV